MMFFGPYLASGMLISPGITAGSVICEDIRAAK